MCRISYISLSSLHFPGVAFSLDQDHVFSIEKYTILREESIPLLLYFCFRGLFLVALCSSSAVPLLLQVRIDEFRFAFFHVQIKDVGSSEDFMFRPYFSR